MRRFYKGRSQEPHPKGTKPAWPAAERPNFPTHIIGAFAKRLSQQYGEFPNRDEVIVARYMRAATNTVQAALDAVTPGSAVDDYTYSDLERLLAEASPWRDSRQQLNDKLRRIDKHFIQTDKQLIKREAQVTLMFTWRDLKGVQEELFSGLVV
jgi:hypothetical protein